MLKVLYLKFDTFLNKVNFIYAGELLDFKFCIIGLAGKSLQFIGFLALFEILLIIRDLLERSRNQMELFFYEIEKIDALCPAL